MDVAGPIRLGGLEHRAEHPVRTRQRTHRRDQLVAHPGDEEPAKPTLTVRDTEGGVACARQLAGAVDESLEHLLDRQLRGDRQDGVAYRLQRRAQLFHSV